MKSIIRINLFLKFITDVALEDYDNEEAQIADKLKYIASYVLSFMRNNK